MCSFVHWLDCTKFSCFHNEIPIDTQHYDRQKSKLALKVLTTLDRHSATSLRTVNKMNLQWLVTIRSDQSLSRVRLFVTPWITAHQASLFITISWSSLRLMSIESMMPSSHLILNRPLLLLPPIPPSIRVFSNQSTLHMRWPKYWSYGIKWD